MEPYTPIDLATFPRREHYEYFCSLAYPYVGATVNVEMGGWLQKRKEKGQPFFLSFLHAVAGAANAVPQLRQRILPEGPVEFAYCPSSYTLLKEDGTWCFCRLDVRLPLEEFLPYAAQTQEQAKCGGDIEDGEEAPSLFFLSSVPWFSFTSLVQPTPSPADSNPRITWGKYFTQEGKTYIPVALLCHHALVDGLHMGQFFEELGRRLGTA